MANPSVILGERLIEDMPPRSTNFGRKALIPLSFAIGFGLTLLLTMSPSADIGVSPQSAVNMGSIPQQQMVFGKKAYLPLFQSSQHKIDTMRVAATATETATNPRKFAQNFGETKTKFQKKVPITHPVFGTFIGDVLNELHFYVFSPQYKYDGLFALGLRELFAAGRSTYDKLQGSGEGDALWTGTCEAVGLDPDQVSKDADAMTTFAKSTPPADILKMMEGTEKAPDALVESAFADEKKKHTNFRSIGLFKVMELSGVPIEKDKAAEWAKAVKIDNSKFMKDLQAFRSNLRKMQEGMKMMEDMSLRDKQRKEKSKEEKKD